MLSDLRGAIERGAARNTGRERVSSGYGSVLIPATRVLACTFR